MEARKVKSEVKNLYFKYKESIICRKKGKQRFSINVLAKKIKCSRPSAVRLISKDNNYIDPIKLVRALSIFYETNNYGYIIKNSPPNIREYLLANLFVQ